MPYTSLFAGRTSKSGQAIEQGKGYTSMFGLSTDNLTKPRDTTVKKTKAPAVQAPKPKPQEEEKKRPTSLFDKVKRTAKDVAKAATTGEQKFAQGIARTLPGGVNDLKAEGASSRADTENLKRAAELKKSGKISNEKYKKLTKAVAEQSNKSSKELQKTTKAMPTKTQIALGAASTAADIISGGTFGAITKGAKAGKVFKGAQIAKGEKALQTAENVEKAAKATKAGKVGVMAKNTAKDLAPLVATNAAAGGLNAAAGGGSKDDITKNALAGAAFPIALKGGAELTSKVAGDVMSKIRAPKKLLQEQQAKTLLAKTAQKSEAEAAKAAEKAQVQTAKLDQKIELIEAKKADGKFTNVDKTKVKQLKDEKKQLETSAVAATPTAPTTTEPLPATPKTTLEAPAVPKEPVAKVPSAKDTPETKTSGSAVNAESRAVEKGLVKEFKDKAQYKGASYKEEAANAVKLVKENPEEAHAIAMGEKPGNNTVHEVAVAKALENKALQEGDVETLLRLSQSPRHSVTSEAAQRLGAEGFEQEGSVVKNLAKLRKARELAVEKKTGKTVSKATSEEIIAIRAAKAKVPKQTKETFESFVDSLKC